MEEHFKNQLHDMETPPPTALWQQLESRLPNRKRKAIVYWLSAAASILLLLGTVAYFATPTPKQQLAENQNQTKTKSMAKYQPPQAVEEKSQHPTNFPLQIVAVENSPKLAVAKNRVGTQNEKAKYSSNKPEISTAQSQAAEPESASTLSTSESIAIGTSKPAEPIANAAHSSQVAPTEIATIEKPEPYSESFTMELKPEKESQISEPKRFSVRKALQTVADLKSGEKTPGQVLKEEGLALSLPNFLRKSGRE